MTSISSLPAAVLLIDEDPLTLTATAAVLHLTGHDCHMARDGEAALKAVRGLSLDLIVCDVDVEGGEGIRLCRELRAEPNGQDVPLIFVSGQDEPAAIKDQRAKGDCYFLKRPFESNDLVDLVETALWMPHLLGKHRPVAPESVVAPVMPQSNSPAPTKRIKPRRRSVTSE